MSQNGVVCDSLDQCHILSSDMLLNGYHDSNAKAALIGAKVTSVL